MPFLCLISVLLVSGFAGFGLLSMGSAVLLGVGFVLLFAAASARSAWGFLPLALFSCASSYASVDPETSGLVIEVVGHLVSNAGSFGWFEWVVLGGIVLHFAALVVVNLTPTPADDAAYGKFYRYLLEPLAGLVIKRKVKQ